MQTFTNPVLEGFSPDPSVCAVGSDYYLVTSTFAYFPGVPIYHSKDLVKWHQIGNVLDRASQLPLVGARHSQGIFAPCIRYHQGIFYMITTNVTHGGNFYVTATNPAGPWSEPIVLPDAPGIDPSLFFDEDGRCYYVGTRARPEGPRYNGDWEVWLQELDLQKGKLIGVSTCIWNGALRDVVWPEGPHLYKKDGYYYLLIAEGGTGSNHCVTIARSEQIAGPYIGNKNNPILTHRHLGKNYPVQNVGHGDLVETAEGKWYMTCLASRIFDGYSNLGRETFLAEVVWEDGWPVVNPGEGRLLMEQVHALPMITGKTQDKYTFDKITPAFLFLRNPEMKHYDPTVRPGWLRLTPTSKTLQVIDSPTYIGVRQQSMNYRLTVPLELHLTEGGEAGLVILQNDQYFIRLVAVKEDQDYFIRLVTVIGGEETIHGQLKQVDDKVTLILEGAGQKLAGYAIVKGNRQLIAEEIDTHYLSTEVAGGFVGCTLGIYTTTSNEVSGYVDAAWLQLENIDN